MTDEEAAVAQEELKARGNAETEQGGDKVKALKDCIKYVNTLKISPIF
jgi:hypothetical protein